MKFSLSSFFAKLEFARNALPWIVNSFKKKFFKKNLIL